MQWQPVSSLKMMGMGKYDGAESTLEMCALHDAAKHRWEYRDIVNRIPIRLKTWCYAIPGYRFVDEYAIEIAPVYEVTLRVAEAMVARHLMSSILPLFLTQRSWFDCEIH